MNPRTKHDIKNVAAGMFGTMMGFEFASTRPGWWFFALVFWIIACFLTNIRLK